MWTRQELKDKAKGAFKRNYWKSVLVAFILSLITVVETSSSTSGSDMNLTDLVNSVALQENVSTDVIWAFAGGFVAIWVIISILIDLFFKNPLMVGTARFFIANSSQPATINEIWYSFSGGRYLKTVGVIILQKIIIGLFTILLIIPGIIKAYDYYMVPYILADNPDMSATEVLKKSKEMMRGHRWNAFVLNLSFLGWQILSKITCGIVGLFYVDPYVEATDAELYLALKNLNNPIQ